MGREFLHFFRAVLGAALLLSCSTALSQTECLQVQDLQTLKERIEVQAVAEPGALRCEKDSQRYKVYQILHKLRTIQISAAPLSGRYNQDILGSDFWQYFTKRIHKIEVANDKHSSCANGAMAFVAQETHPHIAFLCPIFFNDYYSDYEKISVLLHEARHVEGHPHTLCLMGAKVGSAGGCDDSIEDKGSYAVSTEALAKMVFRGENISEQDKAVLKLALLESLESFNVAPGGIGGSAIYLIEQGGQRAYFFDGIHLHRAPVVPSYKLISRRIGLIAAPVGGANVSSVDLFSQQFRKLDPEGSCAKDFNQLSFDQRGSLVDIINDDIFSACVYGQVVVGRVGHLDREDLQTKVDFSIRSVFTSDELEITSRDSFYLESTEGRFYRLRYDEDDVTVSEVVNPTGGFRYKFFFNSDLTGLLKGGHLLRRNPETSKWEIYPGLEGKRFDFSTRPFLWGHDLVTHE